MNEKEKPRVPTPRRRFFFWWWLAGVAVFLVVLPILAHFYSTSEYFAPELIISRETTYITEPLTPEGLPDYAEALNRRMSQGVTPENNAVVLLLQALGPRPDGEPVPQVVLRRLGVPPLAEQGNYYVSVDEALEQQLLGQPEESKKWYDLQYELESRPWQRQEAPRVFQLLEKNRRPLELVQQASLRPRLYVPLTIRPGELIAVGSSLSLQKAVRSAARDLSRRAMLYLGHGRVEEAWQDLLTVKRLGRLLEQEPLMLPTLLGCAAEGLAAQGAIQLLIHARLDESTALNYLHQWRRLPSAMNVAEVFHWGERFTTLDTAIAFQQATPGERQAVERALEMPFSIRALDINYVLRRANQFYDQASQAMRSSSWPQIKASMTAWERQAEEKENNAWLLALVPFSRSARSELFAGKWLALIASTSLTLKVAELRTRQYDLLVEAGLALAVYRARYGRYPEKLDALVPELLPRVPPDLFAPDRKLTYRREGDGYVLYSVFQNGTDDGGNEEMLSLLWDQGFRISGTSPLPLVAP